MRLDEESVEFGRRHIERFYDTDFFPKHFGLEVLWHNWEEVKKLLVGHEVREIPLSQPRVIPWPKTRGGYRMVHQPDPLSSLVYCAITHGVAAAVEAARESLDSRIACSYRIAISDGSFFESGTGYSMFRERTEELCEEFSHILLTDITDFYNQIYVHRVRNAIATTNANLEQHGREVEDLLMRWNMKTSQGIPVGPASSIIMSEAVLIDVDRFIKGKGFVHTRYVDDFRIFANSKRHLQAIHRELTTYLYNVHRLNLSGEKTKLLETKVFIKETLHNQYELEKTEIFERVREVINPYTQEVENEGIDDEGEGDVEVLQELLGRVLALPSIDLGLARGVIRKAKGLGIYELVPTVLDNVEKLLPVINDVFLYVADVTLPWPPAELINRLEVTLATEVSQEPAFRIWAEWLFTAAPAFSKNASIRAYLAASDSFLTRSRLAIIENDISWIRENRAKYAELSQPQRMAVIFASPKLASDERVPWMKSILTAGSGATLLERWFAKTGLDNAFDHTFAGDDLAF